MSAAPEQVEDVVTLVVPGRPEYLRMARLAAADCGARAGLTIEDIEDLRIAVDELAYALIGDGIGAGTLTLRYVSSKGAVEVVGECPADGEGVVLAELSRHDHRRRRRRACGRRRPRDAPLQSRQAEPVVTLEQRDGLIDDEQTERFRAYRLTRDRALRNELVEQYVDLAHTLARRFANRNEALDDLQQVAVLGLLKAVERFDPERGIPFQAFAIPTVIGELRRHFRDRGWMVRVPRRVQDLHLRMGVLVTDLSQRLGRLPTTADIAAAAGVREDDVLEAIDAGNRYRPFSLDAAGRRDDDFAHLGGADDELSSAEDRAALADLLELLPPREQRVIYLRYFEDMTQSEIAREVGLSQMHVSRLLTRSLDIIRAGSPSQ